MDRWQKVLLLLLLLLLLLRIKQHDELNIALAYYAFKTSSNLQVGKSYSFRFHWYKNCKNPPQETEVTGSV